MKLFPWIKPSTRQFYQLGRRLSGYSLFDWIHGYVYGRWPYLYIGVGTGEHRLSRFLAALWGFFSTLFQNRTRGEKETAGMNFADTYHGKVVSLEDASHLVKLNQGVSLRDLEQVIPYKKARDIIIKNPGHIVVLDCPCRASRPDPCTPLDVCLIIGDPFATFIEEHHPGRSRRISGDEAVEILRAEHDRGHVHHAFFKDAMLGRFYAICNCCSCCCGAMQAWRNGIPMLASSGYVSRVDPERCIGCGNCVEYCQFKALSLENGRIKINRDACMGCGICVSRCEQDALSVDLDPSRGRPLKIHELINRFVRK
jgi:ferredoxin